jgi:hypothetical protein
MLRVASEARIFPLLDLGGHPSPHLEPVMARLSDSGYLAQVVQVDYEFQRGGDEMLQISRRSPGDD